MIVFLTQRDIDDGERDGDMLCVTADEVTGRGRVMFDIPAGTAPGTILIDPDHAEWLTDVCAETTRHHVSRSFDSASIEYQRRFEERAAEQARRHEADPYNEPEFLSADEEGFETEAWTAGGPEEEDA